MNWMTRHFHSIILIVSFRAAKLLSYALVGRDNSAGLTPGTTYLSRFCLAG
jgi:hypothetical protein